MGDDLGMLVTEFRCSRFFHFRHQHPNSFTKLILETQYGPIEICIRGRTIHWFTYTVQQVRFFLDGFNEEGYPIYAGDQKKLINTASGQKPKVVFETDAEKYKTIYLTYD